MEEEKPVFHCWDEEEQRFFTFGDESDPIMQHIRKDQVEFMEKLYREAKWLIPNNGHITIIPEINPNTAPTNDLT